MNEKAMRLAPVAVLLCMLVAMSGWSEPAHASRPVPRQITGCVKQGTLISDNGYTIRVFHSGTRERFDLRAFEGRRIRFNGYLLPGDRYFVNNPPADLGACAASGSQSGQDRNVVKVLCRDMGDGRTLIDSGYLPGWYNHNRDGYEILNAAPANATGGWANRICTIRIMPRG